MIGSLTLAVTTAFGGILVALVGLAMSMARMQRPPVTKSSSALTMDAGLVLFVVGIIAVLFSLGAAAFILMAV